MELLELPTALLLTAPLRGIEVVPRRGGLWRVARTDGVVLGYVERLDDEGIRFRAKRMLARAAGFTVIGDFWTADQAVDALRHA
jgi:hypothetical protein